jgi:hypothetical protein
MTFPLEGPEWDKAREQIEQKISEQLVGRAKMQGWISPKGRLTAKGADAALEFVIGTANGMVIADHPAQSWMLNQAFLCSARGVDSRFPFVEAAKPEPSRIRIVS